MEGVTGIEVREAYWMNYREAFVCFLRDYSITDTVLTSSLYEGMLRVASEATAASVDKVLAEP